MNAKKTEHEPEPAPRPDPTTPAKEAAVVRPDEPTADGRTARVGGDPRNEPDWHRLDRTAEPEADYVSTDPKVVTP